MATLKLGPSGKLCTRGGILAACCTDETCCDVYVGFTLSPSAAQVGNPSGQHNVYAYIYCSGTTCTSAGASLSAMPTNTASALCYCGADTYATDLATTGASGADARLHSKSGLSAAAAYLSFSSTRLWTAGKEQTLAFGLVIDFNSTAGHPSVRVDWRCGTRSGSVTRTWREGRYSAASVASTTTTGTSYADAFQATVYVY